LSKPKPVSVEAGFGFDTSNTKLFDWPSSTSKSFNSARSSLHILWCVAGGMEASALEVVQKIQKILQNAQTDGSFKSTQVTKDIDVDIDVGNLLAVDRNPMDMKRFRYVT